jgi:hypothetical protein
MANTTNYNWETPDDTDLVKDGAAAIRTLGNSIDTTTKALNPETTLGDIAYRSATSNTNTRLAIGTSGQILSVSGGVPAWINNDQGDITEVAAGTGISVASGTGPVPTVSINTAVTADLTTAQTLTNKTLTSPVLTTPTISTIDAKGDLLVGTADNTIGRLAVGTNGHILTADSTVSPTGLKWAAPAGGGKILQVVQATYGTSATSTSTSWADTGLSATITPASSGSRILIFVTQFYELFRNTGDAGGGIALLRGGTFIFGDEAASAPISLYLSPGGSTSNYLQNVFQLAYVDSPSTTSATTYKTQFAVTSSANSGRMKVQLNSNDSSMILMEIGA